jgi:DNA-binding transcriptional LysR family regulator
MTDRHELATLLGMRLDTESLRTFIEVVDRGSMTHAAAALGLTQSAVSWKIKRLESQVGRPLLIRDGHDIRPSFDGRELLVDARTIVAVHDRAVARLSTSQLSGRVRFGTNAELTASNVAALLGRFNVAHPGATVEIVSHGSRDLMRLLDDGELDVATLQVTGDELRTTDIVLWTDQLRWVTSWAWPFDEGEVPIVGFVPRCSCYDEPLATLDAAGIAHYMSFSGLSTAAACEAVAAGLGVAVLPESVVSDELVEWRRAAELAPVEPARQVVRAAPGERRDIADALVETLVADLGDAAA